MERALAEYIVNALWQVPFLAGGAWLLVRALRPAPLIQHRLWLAVLGVAVVLPVFGMAGESAKQPQHTTALSQQSASREALPGNEMQFGQSYPQAHTIRLTATVTHWLVRLYIATVVFGLSRNLWLSLAALMVSGGADAISVIIRGSLLQLGTPPEMRGRVSAMNSLFIGASNELGEFESGLTAQWWGAVRATVAGGIGALAVAGIWAALFPSLRQADELTAEALRSQPPQDEIPRIPTEE